MQETMRETQIHDFARTLLAAHGDQALVAAAQKARTYEEEGKTDDAREWRRVEAALKIMRGPHQS
jgi:hypothetical protein